MKVLNICRDDWANFAYDNSLSLQAVGVDCIAVKLNKHVFNYPKQAAVLPRAEIEMLIAGADVVQLFHSDTTFLSTCKALNKRTIVYHAGSHYRDNYKELNKQFNPVVERSAIALGELMGLGARREVYIVGAIETGDEPEIIQQRPYVFGHFPSNNKVKGTENIVRMMMAVKSQPELSHFRYSTRLIDYEQQRRRMMDCHVYIELFQPTLNGRKYGSFGITALEAAAMGKAVITMNLSSKVYEKHYGDCALIIANTEKEFLSAVVNLLFMTEDGLRAHRHRTRQWVVNKHSHKATGEYILKNILK